MGQVIPESNLLNMNSHFIMLSSCLSGFEGQAEVLV